MGSMILGVTLVILVYVFTMVHYFQLRIRVNKLETELTILSNTVRYDNRLISTLYKIVENKEDKNVQ